MSGFSLLTRDKTAVAEQAGLKLAFPILALCLLIGLITRTLISEERVTDLLQENFKSVSGLQFSKARVSLSSNGFPEFAVIFENVVYESQDVCIGAPLVRADQVKVPIKKIPGGFRFTDLEAKTVNLHIRRKIENCGSFNKEKTSEDAALALPPLAPQEVAVEESTKPKVVQADNIESLTIAELVITDSSHGFPSLQFEKVKLLMGEEKSLHANWILFPQRQIQDYVSNAHIEITEKDKVWNSRLEGTLREGSFAVNVNYDQNTNQLVYHGAGKYLPLNPLLGLMLQFRLAGEHYTSQNIWLSFNFEGESDPQKNRYPLRLKHLQVEGDLGEISFEEAQFFNLMNGDFLPFAVNVKDFDLATFLKLMGRPHPGENFKGLGKFNGKMMVRNSQDVILSGEHSGLELVFSNLGERIPQVISLIQVQAHFKDNAWNVELPKIRPQEGVFDGKVSIRADRDWRHVAIESKFNELTFSSGIQRLMTTGGELSSIEGELRVKANNGVFKELGGEIIVPKFRSANTQLLKSHMKLVSLDENNLKVTGQVEKVVLEKNSEAMDFLKPLLSTNENENELEHLSFVTLWNVNKSMHWSELKATLNKGRSHFFSQGEWNQEGFLTGQALISGGSQKTEFVISGHRDRPEVYAKPH